MPIRHISLAIEQIHWMEIYITYGSVLRVFNSFIFLVYNILSIFHVSVPFFNRKRKVFAMGSFLFRICSLRAIVCWIHL